MAPVDPSHVAATCVHTPVLIDVVDCKVISGLPIPKANLPFKSDVPKSDVPPATSASTIPLPLYHWEPVNDVWVVLTQYSIVMLFNVGFGNKT